MYTENRMLLAVLGATGPTGKHVVRRVLGGGHSVRALVRSPDALADINHDKLTVHRVDIFRQDSLEPHFQSCDAVISCLGARATSFLFIGWTPVNIYTDSIKCIVPAMRTAGVKRLVCMSSASAVRTNEEPWMMTYIFRPFFLGPTLKNMAAMETYLMEECQDIDFTVVKPPGLTDSPSSGTPILAKEGQYVAGGSDWMSREDVSRFICDVIDSSEWNRKLAAVTVERS